MVALLKKRVKASCSFISIKNHRRKKWQTNFEVVATLLAKQICICSLRLRTGRDIFAEPLVKELTIAYIVQRAKEMKIDVAAIECGVDHLHLFVKNWKNWAIPILAGQLKTYSSRMMRKGHWQMFDDKLWGKKFWSAGYFHRTVGAVTAETVKKYISEGQKKHWKKQEQKNQRTLLNYSC